MTGRLPVQIAVTGSVHSVEIVLDGNAAGRIAGAPWALPIDLGAEIAPHELVARALDASGAELARDRQWLNLPRPPAEIALVLERDVSGRARAARFSWETVTGADPARTSVTWDGKTLSVFSGDRIAIPSYDPETTHLLSIEVEFRDGVRGRRDVVLGGRTSAEAGSDLSAVPLRLTSGDRLPPRAELERLLKRKGGALRIVGTEEEGPALVYVVRDSDASEAMQKLGRRVLHPGSTTFVQTRGPWRQSETRLGVGDRVRFVWTQPRKVPGAPAGAELFPSSHDFTAKDGGLPWLLSRVFNPEPGPAPVCVADAVAVAGLHAFEVFGKRAVILLLGEKRTDSSHQAADAVRRFLERMRIPLSVWALGDVDAETRARWGHVKHVGLQSELETAVRDLREELDAQRIVWVEGRWLPQDIELAAGAKGIELVR